MMEHFTIGMQIVPATFAGACFVLLFFYFRFTHGSSKLSLNYFSNFLLALSIFTLLKPFQLLAEDAMLSKIICNVRYIALFPFGGPYFVMATEQLAERVSPIQKRYVFAAGLLFTLVYIPFNTAGGKYQPISLGATTAFAIVFFIGSGLRRLITMQSETAPENVQNKSLYFSIGAVIFGTALAVSSAINIFWPLYFAALPSALFCAYGVFIDLKGQKETIDKLIPMVREDLLQDINVIIDSDYNLQEALDMVGITIRPDTFLVIKPDSEDGDIEARLELREELGKIIISTLDFQLSKDNYLLSKAGNNTIAIAISSENLKLHNVEIQELSENLLLMAEKRSQSSISIGVGDTYSRTFNLKQSYSDAVKAQEYASRAGGNMVLFRGDMTEQGETVKYPEEERSDLLQEIRRGNVVGATEKLKSFLALLQSTSQHELDEFKMHALEFITLVRDVSTNAGVPSTREYFIDLYAKLQQSSDVEKIESMIYGVVEKMSGKVANAPKKRSSELVIKTRDIIEQNIVTPPSQSDVAKKLGVSASHFRRIFKDDMGCTFNQFVTKLKCERAKEMLADPNNNISDIAYDLGFSDSNYFSRVFKKETGISPREYKNSL